MIIHSQLNQEHERNISLRNQLLDEKEQCMKRRLQERLRLKRSLNKPIPQEFDLRDFANEVESLANIQKSIGLERQVQANNAIEIRHMLAAKLPDDDSYIKDVSSTNNSRP